LKPMRPIPNALVEFRLREFVLQGEFLYEGYLVFPLFVRG
jgi:hypothetical protein